MDLLELLKRAETEGVKLEVVGDSLKIEAPESKRELVEELQKRKQEVMRRIEGEPQPTHGTADTALMSSMSYSDSVHTGDPWPRPMDDAAHHGLVGNILAAIVPHSEADPVAILIQFLIAFANVIGRTGFFRAEADKHYGNLFSVLVGKTSKGRKGTSWGYISRLFEKIDPEWHLQRILSGLSSGEGLIWAVRDAIQQQKPCYEGYGKEKRVSEYKTVTTDAGVTDKRLMILESEFASVLKVAAREKNTLTTSLRQAWETGSLHILTRNSPVKASGAHVCIVGHITRGELRRLMSETDLANGLANRFLWLCVQRSKMLPEGGNLCDDEIAALVERVRLSVTFARQSGELKRDKQARELWRDVYPSLSEGKPGLLGAATSRAEAIVMRVAMLYALLDQSSCIAVEHLRAGLAVWQYAEESARYIFGSSLGDSTADDILGELRRQHPEGMTKTQIRNHFQRNRKKSEIDGALSLLIELSLVRQERLETNGRPAEIYHSHSK
jgi:hypothetical protein